MKCKFPDNFVFGVADADLQVIGEGFTQKYEGSEQTMWDAYAKNSGKVFENQTPEIGIDRYSRWKEDIDIMKSMGIKDYRTSISMSRTIRRDGSVNEKSIEWYKTYFKALNEAGISISATLYHWELPYYLEEDGGWLNKETIQWFLKHVKAVAESLGEYIDEYFILNEPWCSSILSYHMGIHAPGKRNLSEALQAAHNLLLAQGLAYEVLRKINPNARISTVYNVSPSYPATNNEEDRKAAKNYDGYFNRWFLDPLFLGKYPQDMIDLYKDHVPSFTEADMETINIGKKLHALGINYYNGSIVKYSDDNELHFEYSGNEEGEKNDLNWPIYLPPHYPEGLFDILERVYSLYKDFGLKRIYVTENGIALNTPWDGKTEIVDDEKRIWFLKGHILQVYKAIEKKIPVEKYFEWTLMDNYEWAEGYRPQSCFGLIHVERPSLQRIWKKSAYWYKNLISTNTLE